MRFIFFSAQYLPTTGGIERYNHGLAKELVSRGHEVSIVTTRLPGVPEHETTDGISIVRLPSWLLMSGRYPLLRARKSAPVMAPLWEGDIACSVIHTRFWAMSLWAARQCHRRKIPALVVEHGSSYLSLGNPLLNTATS